MFLSIKNIPKVNWSSNESLNFKPKFSTSFFLIFGLTIFGLGEGLLILSTTGNSPWSVLAEGISLNSSLSIGAPIDRLELSEIPSASTDQGEFPVVDKINKPSPKPKIVNPNIKKNDVENFGLKFKLSFELQFTFGIFFIDRNIKY